MKKISHLKTQFTNDLLDISAFTVVLSLTSAKNLLESTIKLN